VKLQEDRIQRINDFPSTHADCFDKLVSGTDCSTST